MAGVGVAVRHASSSNESVFSLLDNWHSRSLPAKTRGATGVDRKKSLSSASSEDDSVISLLDDSWHSRSLSAQPVSRGLETRVSLSSDASEDESVVSLLDQSWYSRSVSSHPTGRRRGPERTTSASSPGSANDSVFSLLDRSWYSHSLNPLESRGRHTIISMSTAPEDLKPTTEAETLRTNSSSSDRAIEMPSQAQSCDEEEMRKVFEMFDADKDGVVSVDEVRQYMSKLKFDMSEADTDNLMQSVDQNRNGTVDFDEFFALYQNILSGDKEAEDDSEDGDKEDEDEVLQAFRVFDSNADGFITAPELQAVFHQLGLAEGKSLKNCQNMIESVNKNGSGKVSLKQFRQMMSSKVP